MPNEEISSYKKKINEQIALEKHRKEVIQNMFKAMASKSASKTGRGLYDFDMDDIEPPVRGEKNAKP